eukprot:TRINITY_DN11968_c0_g1_i1.p1 TRINITY_DN11968_c0_g1~~TRINITY_DN11968_c0_g1_i1.p1  ORF type:complete len:511 (-),score=162.80 TRINITY_DN11968_c0_g1_i1:110-1642(-)
MAKAKSNILSSREASKDNITDTTIKLLEIEKEKDFLKNCNDELTDLNTALKTEVNMLQEQLKHLQLNSEKEKNELKKIHSEVMERLNSEILKSKEEVRLVRQSLQRLEIKLTAPASDQEKSNTVVTKMKDYIKVLTTKFALLERDKATLKKMYSETLEELNKAKGEYRAELVEVNQAVEKLEAKLLECKSKFSSTAVPCDKIRAINELQTKLSEAECEKENLKRIYDEKVEELNKANEKLAEENLHITQTFKSRSSQANTDELLRRAEEAESERENYKAKYTVKLEELGKVKQKAEKLREGFEKLMKKKNEEGAKAIKKMEEEMQEVRGKLEEASKKLVESNAEVERLRSENKIVQEKNSVLNLKYQHGSEDANSEEETLESLHQPLEKKGGAKIAAKGAEELINKIELLETEQEKWKQLLSEANQRLSNETESHKQQLLKFKNDYCKVFQEMSSLKKTLRSIQEELARKNKEMEILKDQKEKGLDEEENVAEAECAPVGLIFINCTVIY